MRAEIEGGEERDNTENIAAAVEGQGEGVMGRLAIFHPFFPFSSSLLPFPGF